MLENVGRYKYDMQKSVIRLAFIVHKSVKTPIAKDKCTQARLTIETDIC